MDPDIKAEVELIYSRYGMTLTQAINLFLYASRNADGLPFDLRPNPATRQAIKEGAAIVDGGPARSATADELLAELNS
jgi:DNA-damage-inducible protein J